MELVAVRGDDQLFTEDPSLPMAEGWLVQPAQEVIWHISLATALAGGYWDAPGDQPPEAEIEVILDSFPTREHPSIQTRARSLLPPPGEEDAPLES